MSRLSDIGTVQVGEDSVPLKVVTQGYGSTWMGQVNDRNGRPLNLDGSVITAKVEFMKANINVTTTLGAVSVSVTGFTPIDDMVDVDLVVAKLTNQSTPANTGKFTVVIPTNLYVAEIPPDITSNVPVAIGYIKRVSGNETRVARFIIAFRRGLVG